MTITIIFSLCMLVVGVVGVLLANAERKAEIAKRSQGDTPPSPPATGPKA